MNWGRSNTRTNKVEGEEGEPTMDDDRGTGRVTETGGRVTGTNEGSSKSKIKEERKR